MGMKNPVQEKLNLIRIIATFDFSCAEYSALEPKAALSFNPELARNVHKSSDMETKMLSVPGGLNSR